MDEKREVIYNSINAYCVSVVQQYKRAFLTPFLFKVKDHPAFLVDCSAFFDDSCLPSINVLSSLFPHCGGRMEKLKDQDTFKKELEDLDELIRKQVLSPEGREHTFARDLIRFMYEILFDDTTIGCKGQDRERVKNVKPFLLKTRQTTQQIPHLDSEMGTITKLTVEADTKDDTTTRKSKRARKKVTSYNEDEMCDTVEGSTITIEDADFTT